MAKPTNSDIYSLIQETRRDNKDIRKNIVDHEARLRHLENFKIAYEAAAKALEGIPSRNVSTLNSDFVKVVLKFLSVITTMLGIIYLLVQQFGQ